MNHLKAAHDDTQFEKLAKERTINQAELSKLRDQISTLEDEKQSLTAGTASLTGSHKAALEEAQSKHRAELASLQTSLAVEKAAAAKLVVDSQKAGASVSDAQGEIGKLKLELKKSGDRTEELERESGELKTALSESRALVEKKDGEIQAKCAEVRGLFEQKSALESAVEKEKAELKSIGKALDKEKELRSEFSIDWLIDLIPSHIRLIAWLIDWFFIID